MNIINKLTIRNLKENKRRTLVTIIGVIISVAMVTAVSTLAVSFLDLLKKQTIADSGEWHVLYKNVNKEQLNAIKDDDATKTVVVSKDIGYAMLEGSQNDTKPYLFLKRYNEQGFTQFPIELIDGRLPTAANEVVISDHIETNAQVNYKIGDTLTLEVGERFSKNGDDTPLNQTYSLEITEENEIAETLTNEKTETLKIVGIIKRPTWEPAWSPGYTIISFLDEQMIGQYETANATVVLKKVTRSLFDHAEKLAQANGIEMVDFNYDLLRYDWVIKDEGLNRTLFSLSAIIMSIIMIGSVSLIYNAFAISVSERSRQLGMLSSVGATKKQKRNSVFFEGAIIGLISIPIGIISGLVGIGITFIFINSMIEGALGVTEKLSLTVTPMSILVACIISIVTIFISTYIPARRASKVSAIDAIRQSMDIKLTRKAVKTSKLVRKLFGIEAEIGLKNLKRNKRRYVVTVFSLVISIVLFLTVAFFTDNLKKSLGLSQEGLNYDMMVSQSQQDDEVWERLVQSIANMDDVTAYNDMEELHLSAWIDKAEVAEELKNDKHTFEDDKYPYYVVVHTLDQHTLEAYAKMIGINVKELEATSDSLPAIVIDSASHYDENEKKYVETKAIHTKIGNKIDLYDDPDRKEATHIDQIEVVALTAKYPMGMINTAVGGLNVIVSESSFHQLEHVESRSYLYLISTDPLKTQQEIEELKEPSIFIHNIYQNRQQEQQFITILSVFTYGFIALITAISIANIFNTISTSVSLRKREFGMLKSVGMTPKGFNKMMNYESIFYGIKALLYGIPLSIGVMYLIYQSLMNSFDYKFELPWLSLLFAVIAIFMIVGSAMLYSSAKVKKENIIDALKQENI